MGTILEVSGTVFSSAVDYFFGIYAIVVIGILAFPLAVFAKEKTELEYDENESI
jgi:hypothetical protein